MPTKHQTSSSFRCGEGSPASTHYIRQGLSLSTYPSDRPKKSCTRTVPGQFCVCVCVCVCVCAFACVCVCVCACVSVCVRVLPPSPPPLSLLYPLTALIPRFTDKVCALLNKRNQVACPIFCCIEIQVAVSTSKQVGQCEKLEQQRSTTQGTSGQRLHRHRKHSKHPNQHTHTHTHTTHHPCM